MSKMTKITPSMTRSRIDIVYVARTHKDLEATALMSLMMVFEMDISSVNDHLVAALKDRKMPANIKEILDTSISTCMKMGARDLEAITRRFIESLHAEDTSAMFANALLWTRIADETRVANVALFQSCQLFGRALNGKHLPSVSS